MSTPAQPYPGPPQQAPEPIPAWYQHAQSSGYMNLPDDAYNAMRDKFYDENVAPMMLQKGLGYDAARDEFNQKTTRPGTTEWPRTKLTAASAASALTFGGSQDVEHYKAMAETGAERAGVTHPGAYEFAGEMLGSLPAFATGMGLAGGAAEAMGMGELATRGMKSLAAGLVQGSYDYAKDQSQHPFIAGMKGFAGGAAVGAAFEFAKPLASYLSEATGLTPEVAQSVADAAQGKPITQEATDAVASVPHIEDHIKDWVSAQVQAAKQNGVVKDVLVDDNTPPGRLKVKMTGADGKPYSLGGAVGMKLEDIDKIVDRLNQNLQAGGSIDTINGSPEVLAGFQRMLEVANASNFDLDYKDTQIRNGIDRTIDNRRTDSLYHSVKPEDVENLLSSKQLTDIGDSNQLPDTEGIHFEVDRSKITNGNASTDAVKNATLSLPKVGQDTSSYFDAADKLRAAGIPVDMKAPEAPGKRFAVSLQNVPPLDMPEGETPPDQPMGEGRTRASADVPLNDNGLQQVDELGRKFAQKGGLDGVASTDLTRNLQTAQALLRHNPEAQWLGHDQDFQSWRGMEGEPDRYARPFKESMAQEQPDTPLPGSAQATQPPESFNQFTGRALAKVGEAVDSTPPDKKVGIVTHSSVINTIRAQGKDGTIDPAKFFQEHEDPGDVYHATRDESGRLAVRKVDMDAPAALQNGVHLIRHGETDWNTPKVKFRETGLVKRYSGDTEAMQLRLGESTRGAMTPAATPGGKPTLEFNTDKFSPDTLFHEYIHAHSAALQMENDIRDAAMKKPGFVRDVFKGAFDEESQAIYKKKIGLIPEEVFAYTAAAIRTGDHATLDDFARADTDKEHVLNWAVDVSRDLKDRLAEMPDSLHKRAFERRLDSVEARGGRQLQRINDIYAQAPGQVSFEDGGYVYRDTDTVERFTHRDQLTNWLDERFQQPLTSPEFVDTSALSDNIPRYARDITPPSQQAALTTDPPPPQAGTLLFSHWFRPFYDWLGSVAQKYGRQDLYNAGAEIRDATVRFDNAIAPYVKMLHDTIFQYEPKRQPDFFRFIQADDKTKPNVVQELRLSDAELDHLREFKAEMEKGGMWDELHKYATETQPQLANLDYNWRKMWPQIGEKHDDMYRDMIMRGQLDPRDTNLVRIAAMTVRRVMMRDHLDDQLSDFLDIAHETRTDVDPDTGDAKKVPVFGLLQPLLERHVNYIRGTPDWTQRAMSSAIDNVIDKINSGISKVNEHLPERLQINPLEMSSKDALDKWILFSYAGGLALRPAIPIRDALQYFVTTYPVLGGKYTAKAMRESFAAIREGTDNSWYKEAKKYGALINRSNISEMYTGGVDAEGEAGHEGGLLGKVERFSQKAMGYIQTAHNSNRLVAFTGHTLKAQDALEAWGRTQDTPRLIKDSDLWFLAKPLRTKYMHEIQLASEAGREDWSDISKRIAKDLVDATQWNYRKGAGAGLYKYQLGRIFGQYGTWPLNYIEYARRFMTSGDKEMGLKALSRLVVSHFSILAAGEAAGIDTSHWVFTQPAAYGGGPLFQTALNIPASLDFQSRRGEEARSEIGRTFFPGIIPGGDEFEGMYDSLVKEDKHFFLHAMGFTPLDEKDQDTGYHKFVPF